MVRRSVCAVSKSTVAPKGETEPSLERLRRETGPRPYRWSIVASGLLSLLIGVAEAAALAGLAGLLTEDAALKSRLDWLSRPWMVVALAVVSLLLNLANNAVLERATARWSSDRRMDLAAAFSEADFPYQRKVSAGSLIAVTEQVGAGARVLASDLAIPGTFGRALVYLVAAFVASWQTALIAGVCGALLMVSLRVISRRTRRLNQQVTEGQVGLGEAVGDMVSSAREIRQLDRWPSVVSTFGAELHTWRTAQLWARWTAGAVAPLFFSGILLVGLATAMFSGGNSAAKLAASGMLLVRALGALQTCQLVLQQRNDAIPSRDRVITTIADLRHHRRVATGDVSAGEVAAGEVGAESVIGARLEFVDASFGYGSGTVLDGVNLRLSGPGAVAVLGESGAGKSTLLAAASGLVRPQHGQVVVGGRPLDELTPTQVSQLLGMCSQDTATIEGTVRDNLLRRGSEVGDERVLEVLGRLRLAETIAGFGGLDARLGRSFDGLSGGELQRLGVARLILNEPKIWLLDEPTSALDRANAELVYAEIERARAAHLVVIVTHRPELLELCESFVLVAEGRVTDSGPSAQMAATHPFIARMLAYPVPAAGPDSGPSSGQNENLF
jgi:ABC-type multidrug transport system fused ATPase/permease subunit